MKYAFVDGNHLRVTFAETVEKLFDQHLMGLRRFVEMTYPGVEWNT